jgi:hypothetical protein
MIKGAAPAAVDLSWLSSGGWRNRKTVPCLWPRQPAQRLLLRRLTVCHFQRSWDTHATWRRNSPQHWIRLFQSTADVTSCLIRSALSSFSPADRARNEPTPSSAASLPAQSAAFRRQSGQIRNPMLPGPTMSGGTRSLSRGQETWPAIPGAASNNSFPLPHCDLEAASAATPRKHGQDGRLVAQPKPAACRQPPTPSH